jgi:hypothetical protein
MIPMRIPLLMISAGLLSVLQASPADKEFVSNENAVPLLELFTSEGCSSCPPAEEWFSQLRQNPSLWRDIVPVAFHVDYWNSLGWTDPYSSPEWSSRQREYSQVWKARSVYTPGFVLNGHEWRVGEAIPKGTKTGILKIRVGRDGSTDATYTPSNKSKDHYFLNVAPLVCGVSQLVPRGENTGRTLRHDFVALTLLRGTLEEDSNGSLAAHLKIPPEIAIRMNAVAAWVTSGESQMPIQSVGGWVK